MSDFKDISHKADKATRKLVKAGFYLTIDDCEYISNKGIVYCFNGFYKLYSPIKDFNPIGITTIELIEVLPTDN